MFNNVGRQGNYLAIFKEPVVNQPARSDETILEVTHPDASETKVVRQVMRGMFGDPPFVSRSRLIDKNKDKDWKNQRDIHAREVAVMKQLGKHKNIITYLGNEKSDVAGRLELFLYMQDGGQDLLSYYERGGINHKPDVADVIDHISQAACGVAFMHGMKIMHRDIKLENLLIKCEGKENIIRLSDFEYAVDLGAECPPTGRDGTMEYMALETLRGQAQGTPVDIHCLGVSALTLLSLASLLNDPPEAKERLRTSPYFSAISAEYTEEGKAASASNAGLSSLVDLVREMILENPQSRPSANTVHSRLKTLYERYFCPPVAE